MASCIEASRRIRLSRLSVAGPPRNGSPSTQDSFWTSVSPRSFARNRWSRASRPAVSGAGSAWKPNSAAARSGESPESGRNSPLHRL